MGVISKIKFKLVFGRKLQNKKSCLENEVDAMGKGDDE